MKMSRQLAVRMLVLALVLQSLVSLGFVQRSEAADMGTAIQPALIAAGNNYTLFIGSDGIVYVSGADSYGGLGLGTGTSSTSSIPKPIPGLTNAAQVAVGDSNSYAVLQDGTVKVWGRNANGLLGLGNTSSVYTPTIIPNLNNVQQIRVGTTFAVALLKDGRVFEWGATAGLGELGGISSTSTPTEVPGISNVKQIAVGDRSVIALLQNGEVWSWGYNYYGQLGQGDTTNRSAPTKIASLSNVVQVAAGAYFAMALLQDGSVKSWGYNVSGQLGINTTVNSSSPVAVSGLANVRSIAAGGASAVAVLNTDAIMAWGNNYNSQLGLGDTTNRLVPQSVSLSYRVTNAYVSSQYDTGPVFLIASDSKVYAAGPNGGRLGTGDTATKPTFTNVAALQANAGLGISVNVTAEPAGVYSSPFANSSFMQSNGQVYAWGYNGYGQLGLGDTTNRYTPTLIQGLSGVKQVVTGYGHTLALMEDGTVKAWGYNVYGQLGLGDTTTRYTPVTVPGLSNVKQLAAGYYYSLALMNDGTVKAWGYNAYGQLGTGDTTTRYTPVTVSGLSDIKQLAAGYAHTLALLSDGTVKAWGYNTYGQLGLGDTSNRTSPATVSGLSGVQQLAAGYYHTFALLTDGTLKAWGYNASGQLGLGDTTTRLAPAAVTGVSNAAQVIAGANQGFAQLSDGRVMAWGENGYGQLGFGDTTTRYVPTLISGVSDVQRLAAGYYHTLALLNDGIIKAWGYNSNGQLGAGDSSSNRTFPAAIASLFGVQQLASGLYHSLALLSDGTVKTWGYNSSGQLGLGDTTARYGPTSVPGLLNVKQLIANAYWSMALLKDGTVKAWGANDYGQLGLGDMTTRYTPTTVPGLSNVKQLATGYNFGMALLNDGTVKAWGYNGYGQLGAGDYTTRTTPTTVPGLSGVQQLAAGYYHAVALMGDGTVKAWGYNTYGQLGLGDTTNRTTPETITGLSGVQQLTANGYSSFALMTDGTMKSWGYNNYGQLGLGDTATRSVPASLLGLSGVKQVAASYYHTFALLNDGTLKTWGYNSYGELGVGDTTTRYSPATVSTLSGVKQAAAGYYHSLVLLSDGTVRSFGYNNYGQLGLGIQPSSSSYTPLAVTQLPVNRITISATVNGPSSDNVNIRYYLDDEADPRGQISTVLNSGSAAVSFEPLPQASLAIGTHTVRIVANTANQTSAQTASFTVQNTSYDAASGVKATASERSIRIDAGRMDSLGELAPLPYRFTVGAQTSGWLAPSTTLNSVVSGTALNLPGTGNKKVLRLSNGWWVVAGYTGNATTGIVFQVSKDQGKTWSQLATLADSANIVSNPAITASGTLVIGLVRYGATGVRAFTFDAATQTNENILGKTTVVDTNQTDIPTTSSVAIEAGSGGKVYAVWLSKNATYPGSYNLRYAASLDNGLTWQTSLQVTTYSSSSYNYANPTVLLVNGLPMLFSEYVAGSSYYLYQYMWNASTSRFDVTSLVSGGAYPQQDYSVIADSSSLYLFWSGTDATDSAVRNIRYQKSTNGGTTWSTAVKLTSGNSYNQQYPVIALDSNHKFSVVFSGIDPAISATTPNLRLLTSTDGTTWSSIKTLTSLTSGGADQPVLVTDPSVNVLTDNPIVLYKDVLYNRTAIRGAYESGASYTATGLSPNTRYNVLFEAKDAAGTLHPTSQSVVTRAAVPVVTVTQSAGQAPLLTLSDDNPTGTLYQVTSGAKYWSTEGAWLNQASSFALPSKTLRMLKLDSKKSYKVKIRAINQDGVASEWSNAVNVGAAASPPAIPKNVKTQPTSAQVTLSWSPVSEATSYEIEADGQTPYINNGRTLSYVHSGLVPNTLHQYRVRAIKDGTPGEWSAPVLVRTLLVAPIVPAAITAAATAKTVTLTWGSVAGAYAYEVQWDGQTVSVGKQTSFTQGGLVPATGHTYRVRALNAGGASPWSIIRTVTTGSNVPTVPVVTVAKAEDKVISLTWPALADALAYEAEADGAVIQLSDATTASFTGLNPVSAHAYRIRAVNEVGAGAWSSLINVTTALLPTPAGVQEQVSDQAVSFSWSAVSGATSYQVEADGQVSSVSLPTFNQGGLTPETTHTYRIRAVASGGNSAWTDAMRRTTLPLKPAVPSGISATASKTQVYLTWTPVGSAVGYDVELDGKVVIDNFTSTVYTDTLLDPYSAHTYRIRARTDAIAGDWSALVSLNTLPTVPGIPTNIALTSAGNLVTLRWDGEPSATKYEVEVDGQVFDTGGKAEYTHRRVGAGTEHKYRIRTTNVSGVGAWSGYIINNTITAKLTKAKTFDVGLAGVDVLDFRRYTLQVTYDPNAIEITDLSTLTAAKELTAGRIPGTEITVVDFKPGLIVYTTDKAISPDESWTGVINSIQMRAKVSGGSSLTYSVIEKPAVQATAQ